MDIRSILKSHLFYMAATLALVALLLSFGVLPLQERVRVASDDIQKIHAKSEQGQRKISRLSDFESQFESVRNDERKIGLLLPESDVVEFIKSVEEIAKVSSGEVAIAQGVDLSVAKKPVAKDLKEKPSGRDDVPDIASGLPWKKQLPLEVTFSGSYAATVNFLHRVETMPYRTDVVALDIRPVTDDQPGARTADLFAPSGSSSGETALVLESLGTPEVVGVFDIVVYLEE